MVHGARSSEIKYREGLTPDAAVIGTRYAKDQRERIRAALPNTVTCELGIQFEGGHGDASTGDKIIADLATKLK